MTQIYKDDLIHDEIIRNIIDDSTVSHMYVSYLWVHSVQKIIARTVNKIQGTYTVPTMKNFLN